MLRPDEVLNPKASTFTRTPSSLGCALAKQGWAITMLRPVALKNIP